MPALVDPGWWDTASIDGRPLRDVLAGRDMTALFRFLRRRGLSRARIAGLTGLSETRVRQIWQGRQQITSYEVLERLAHGLGIPRGYLGLGYTDAADTAAPVPAQSVDPADDPGFLATLAAVAVSSASTDLARVPPTDTAARDPVPTVVTAHHVDVLCEVTGRHRLSDAEYGGGCCRDSAVAYVRWATGMLHSRFTHEAVERRFKKALADLHQVAGWACHDLGDHHQARRHLVAALALAREAGDLAQAAGCFYRLGRVSMHQQRAGEALKLWQLGHLVAQDSGCPVAVAVLCANQAWAYAHLGDDTQARDHLRRAEAELGRADPDTAPAWARFFLAPADFDGMSTLAYTSLATHRQHRPVYAPIAADRAERALALRRPGESRSRVFDAVSAATAHLLTGQAAAAHTHAQLAVDLAATVASQRVHDRLSQMLRLAPASGFDDIRQRVDELTNGDRDS
jgi:transcriptional regulator with XRE-family HTH domain/tetratricopeptide (TPR) repeat protein